jgi:hypothetical protein
MKVVFAVSTVFHIEHLKRIYRQWDKAEFLLFSAKDRDAAGQMAAHLERTGCRGRHIADFLASQDRADVMFSVYWQPAFLVMGPETMHVRIMYGYAKDEWNYADWNGNYDLIFAYGPYAEERLKRHAPCISVGHPRDPGPDRAPVHPGGKPAGGGRPVLLYCPTYGEMSSLPDMDRMLPALAERFEVVVKLHHASQADHYPCLTRLAAESRIRLCDQSVDLFGLLPACDLVVSDHSGAIFDAMLMEKPIVLVDSKAMKGRIQAELGLDAASLDIKVRRMLPHFEAEDLVDGIRHALKHPPAYGPFLDTLYAGIGTDVPGRIRDETTARFRRFSGANRQRELFERLVRFVEQDGRELVILGAGDFGQAVMQLCKTRGFGRIRFIDGDPAKHGREIEGSPVDPPGRMDGLAPSKQKCLVATVGGASSYEERLKRIGFVSGRDYIKAF